MALTDHSGFSKMKLLSLKENNFVPRIRKFSVIKREIIVAYFLKARTVEPEKQSLLANSKVATRTR
jgi:hypothetical protein